MLGEEITRAGSDARVEMAGEGVGQSRCGRTGGAEQEESTEGHGSRSTLRA